MMPIFYLLLLVFCVHSDYFNLKASNYKGCDKKTIIKLFASGGFTFINQLHGKT